MQYKNRPKFRDIVWVRLMDGIVLLKLLVGDFRRQEIQDHHLELDALSFEDYSVRKTPKLLHGRLSKFRVQRRFRSDTAESLYSGL